MAETSRKFLAWHRALVLALSFEGPVLLHCGRLGTDTLPAGSVLLVAQTLLLALSFEGSVLLHPYDFGVSSSSPRSA
jgi:hypothetical protein